MKISQRERPSWRLALALLLPLLLGLCAGGTVRAGALDEMSLERWAKLREAERYQLNIAEKFYREQQWKPALSEYEKFLSLYEKSEGAPFAQMKWSICQVNLRKANTAIKDGFKTVIDYWPESPEAITSAYLIGRTYKEMGETKQAKQALATAIGKHPKHIVAVLARLDLLEMARKENDTERIVSTLRQLTFETERLGEAARHCVLASRELAQHYFLAGNFDEGIKALATSYKEEDLPTQLREPKHGRLSAIVLELTGQADVQLKQRGERLADAAIVYIRNHIPTDLKVEAEKARAQQYWLYIAEIQASAHRPEKQREVYEQMLKTFGNDDKLLGELAGWYKANKRPDEARRIYLQFKDPIAGQERIAYSFREEKKFDQAIDAYRKLSNQDDKQRPRWMSEVAATYIAAGKADEAIGVYRELLTADAGHAADHHWSIAVTLQHFGRWKEAITAFRGTERFPENYQRMAGCHRQLKQYSEAILLYRQIVASHPASASWAMLQIAYTYETADQKEPAIKSFQQVCDRYPKSDQASEAHTHLINKYKIRITLGGAKDE